MFLYLYFKEDENDNDNDNKDDDIGDDLREEQALPMDSALLLCHPAGASNNYHRHRRHDYHDDQLDDRDVCILNIAVLF